MKFIIPAFFPFLLASIASGQTASGITIPGRVVWEGKPSLDRDELFVSVTPADSMVSFNSPARVVGSSFVLRDVFDGTYRLRVIGQSKEGSRMIKILGRP